MNIRRFTPNDHPEIASWWTAQGWPVLGPKMLSSTGFVAHDGDFMVAAGWFYVTDSSWGWIEWLVANPKAGLKQRAEGLELVLAQADNWMAEHDIEALISSVSEGGLKRLYERCGFVEGDTGMANMIFRRR